jgi:hypothetical protein
MFPCTAPISQLSIANADLLIRKITGIGIPFNVAITGTRRPSAPTLLAAACYIIPPSNHPMRDDAVLG